MLHVIEAGTATHLKPDQSHDKCIDGLSCLDPFGMGDSANSSRTLFQGPDHFPRRHHCLPLRSRSGGDQGLLEGLLLGLQSLEALHVQGLELAAEPLQRVPSLLDVVGSAFRGLGFGKHLADR